MVWFLIVFFALRLILVNTTWMKGAENGHKTQIGKDSCSTGNSHNQEGYAKEEKDIPFSSCNLIDCGMLSWYAFWALNILNVYLFPFKRISRRFFTKAKDYMKTGSRSHGCSVICLKRFLSTLRLTVTQAWGMVATKTDVFLACINTGMIFRIREASILPCCAQLRTELEWLEVFRILDLERLLRDPLF